MRSLRKMFDWFRTPSAEQLARIELEEARRELLKAQAGAEYSAAMVNYQSSRVRRLSSMLNQPL